MPSVNSTANRARSAVTETISLSGVMWIRPRNPSLTSAPPTRKSKEVDRTVRAARPGQQHRDQQRHPEDGNEHHDRNPRSAKRADLPFADQASRHTAGNHTRSLRGTDRTFARSPGRLLLPEPGREMLICGGQWGRAVPEYLLPGTWASPTSHLATPVGTLRQGCARKATATRQYPGGRP